MYSLVEDGLETLTRHRRALHIFNGADLLRHRSPLRLGRHVLVASLERRLNVGAVAQIELRSDEYSRHVGRVVQQFRIPLRVDVFERRRLRYRIAHEKDVRHGIGKRSNSIVVVLTGRVPETDAYHFAVYRHVRRIVVESTRSRANEEAIEGRGAWFVFVYAYTVGTYSSGNLFVVYDMSMQVLPTAPSPTTTHLTDFLLITAISLRRSFAFLPFFCGVGSRFVGEVVGMRSRRRLVGSDRSTVEACRRLGDEINSGLFGGTEALTSYNRVLGKTCVGAVRRF